MTALLIVVYSLCGIYMLFNFKHDLHMLQQNSYRISRYWRYIKKYDAGSLWRLSDVAMLFLIFSRLLETSVAAVFMGVFCVTKTLLILRQKFKKPLVFTKRVIRLYCVSSAIFLGFYLWDVFKLGFQDVEGLTYSGPVLALGILLLMSIFSWMIIMLSTVVLMPVEKSINNKYIKDAKGILHQMPDLKVIGVTGSYGKTSTKHFLERILSEKFDVIMTPGSFNTPMGVVRTIRENMKPYHTIFICEMGAKQKGDIKEICDIVHPEIGIVTAVGPMHLETFKTLENVCNTKFELIDALPKDGFGIVNNDFEACAERTVNNVNYARYSTHEESEGKADYVAKDIFYTSEGTDFSVSIPSGAIFKFHTNLVGDCNISNLLAAVIAALKLGMNENEIKRGVAAIEQVEHRLNIKKTPGGFTIIDDAYNSNPYGSKMALEVLSGMKDGRRIIITPGMIELGDKQYELNEQLGEEIGKNVDLAFIVGEYNREALLEGIRKTDLSKDAVYVVDSFKEAQDKLSMLLKKGDTVLYENDLPDTFK